MTYEFIYEFMIMCTKVPDVPQKKPEQGEK